MRAAVYCRISRDRVGAGLGVARQEADCRELAVRHGWTVARVYSDNDLSAYSGKPRPEYLRLLGDITAGSVDVVIVWHTDRLHRSPTELEQYISAADAHSVPTHTVKAGPLDLATPSGRLVARQLGAVARYEVEHAIERQRRAKLQAATDGRWKGGRRPYGYEPDGVTVRPDEAQVVREATAAVLAGGSLRGLAADLNRRGVATSTGGRWRPETVGAMLLRARNAGLMVHQGKVIGPAGWPALVPEDEWRAAAAILSDPGRRTQWASGRRWLLSGLAVCGVCGGRIICTQSMASRRPVHTYVCGERKHVTRVATTLDAAVVAAVVGRLSQPDAADLLAADSPADLHQLHAAALSLRAKLDELAAAYADDLIDAQQLRQGSDRVRRRLAQVEDQIAVAAQESVLAGVAGAEDVQSVWEGLPLDRRRAIVSLLVEVTVLPSCRGRPPGWRPGHSYFDPASVRLEWQR